MRLLWPPARRFPLRGDFGTEIVRSGEWYWIEMPRGILADTAARVTTTPWSLKTSTQSLSSTPIAAASCSLSQKGSQPRDSTVIRSVSP